MNSSRMLGLVLLAGSLFAGYQFYQQAFPPAPTPLNVPPPAPPLPPPVPPKPVKPWGPGEAVSVETLKAPLRKPKKPSSESPFLGGPRLADGTEVMTDIPISLRKQNIGGSNGLGLCVFTSIMHAARYQHEMSLWNFQEQMSHEPGGGYPAKVDLMIKKYAPGVHYLQYEGKDTSIMELALKTDRAVSLTWNGRDPHYGFNRTVAHMVNLIHLDKDKACILDNNFTQTEDDLVWCTKQELVDRWIGGDENGWCVILLKTGAPPVPLK